MATLGVEAGNYVNFNTILGVDFWKPSSQINEVPFTGKHCWVLWGNEVITVKVVYRVPGAILCFAGIIEQR